MPLKSVLDIDLNDSAFKDFQKTFDRFLEQTKKLPANYAEATKNLGHTKQRFQELLALEIARGAQQRQQLIIQREAERLSRTMADKWKEIGRGARTFGENIERALRNVIRLVGPTAVLGGLIGAGAGLFGFDRLAQGVAAQRTNVLRLGGGAGTYGQVTAFGINYGRFGDTSGILSNVSTAQFDKTSPQYKALLAAGLSPQFIASHSAAEVAQAFLTRAPRVMQQSGKGLSITTAKAFGFTDIAGEDYLKAYMTAGEAERADVARDYQSDATRFNVSPATQRQYTEFITTLQRAGAAIDTTLVKGLAGLTDPISHLSDAFTKLLESALGSQTFKEAIDAVASGMESFAKYIGTEDFKQNVKDFVEGIGALAHKIVDALRFLGVVPEAKATIPPGELGPGYKGGTVTDPMIGSPRIGTTGTHGAYDGGYVYGPNGRIPLGHPAAGFRPSAGNRWLTRPHGGGAETGSGVSPSRGAAYVVTPSGPVAIHPGASGVSHANAWMRRPEGGLNQNASAAERVAFYRKYAEAQGVNPDMVEGIVRAEGLYSNRPGRQNLQGAPAWGDFQLHFPGLGRYYAVAHPGHAAWDEKLWKEQGKFAIDWMRDHPGFHDWDESKGSWGRWGVGRPQPHVKVSNATGGDIVTTSRQAIGE